MYIIYGYYPWVSSLTIILGCYTWILPTGALGEGSTMGHGFSRSRIPSRLGLMGPQNLMGPQALVKETAVSVSMFMLPRQGAGRAGGLELDYVPELGAFADQNLVCWCLRTTIFGKHLANTPSWSWCNFCCNTHGCLRRM